MCTKPTSPVEVKRPTGPDLETTVHALHSIFWALNMLVIHAADDIAHEGDRINGIDQLILAGQLITKDMADRF